MCSLYSSEPSEAAGAVRGDGSPFTPLSTKVNFPTTSVPANNLPTDSCCTPHKKFWPLRALADFSCLPLRSTLIFYAASKNRAAAALAHRK